MISLRDTKNISLRLDNDFFILKIPSPVNFNRTEGAFQYNGPKVWNSLPYVIRSIGDINNFKKCLKTYYFNIAFSEIK